MVSDKYPDFTGHWKQVRNENADGYLKSAGVPYPIRRIAVPIMGRSTDIIRQAGNVQVVTTINAKGTWTRKYVTGTKVEQKNAEGDMTTATTWWEEDEEGRMVHKTRLDGGKRGPSESWRWFEGETMVVKSLVFKKKEVAWMLWYFESIEQETNEAAMSAKKKLKRITREQRLIAQITEKQNQEMIETIKGLTSAQQVFIEELLKKTSGKEKVAQAASKWKGKASPKGKVPEPSPQKSGLGDSEDSEEFYDASEVFTDEQKEALDKAADEVEMKVSRFSVEDEQGAETLTDEMISGGCCATGALSSKSFAKRHAEFKRIIDANLVAVTSSQEPKKVQE